MASPNTKVLIPASPAANQNRLPSRTADYVYRIAAMMAGIALLMTVV